MSNPYEASPRRLEIGEEAYAEVQRREREGFPMPPAMRELLEYARGPRGVRRSTAKPTWHQGLHAGEPSAEAGGCEVCNPAPEPVLERAASLIGEHWEQKRWEDIEPAMQEIYREHARATISVPVLWERLKPLLAEPETDEQQETQAR